MTDQDIQDYLSNLCDKHPIVDRVTVYQYTILIGIDNLEVQSNIEILLIENQDEVITVYSDFSKRDLQSFKICSLVGKEVKRIALTERGLELELKDGQAMKINKHWDFENFQLSSPDFGTYLY